LNGEAGERGGRAKPIASSIALNPLEHPVGEYEQGDSISARRSLLRIGGS
jgi:hypothetical protein